MNLYYCTLVYLRPAIVNWHDEASTQRAAELIAATDEEQARHLFYQLHQQGLQRHQVAPEQIEVELMVENIGHVPEGRFYDAETVAISAILGIKIRDMEKG